MFYRLLTIPQVIELWPIIEPRLARALAQNRGEMTADDARAAILSHRMYAFAGIKDDAIVSILTAQFVVYPRYTVLVVVLGEGDIAQSAQALWAEIQRFGALGGADRVQIYCQGAARRKLFSKVFEADEAYTVLEKAIWPEEAQVACSTKTRTDCSESRPT